MSKHNTSALPSCDGEHTAGEAVALVREKMPDFDTLYDLAELFFVFGDSTRIRILYALLQSPLCVCDIARVLDMSVSAISHQLRLLKQSDLVKYRRNGKTVYYSLSDDHVKSILAQGMDHIME